MFDLWFSHDDPNIDIRSFSQAVRGLLGDRPTLCTMSGNCLTHLAVSSTGEVYPCDWFMGDRDYRLGNVLESTVPEIYESRERMRFVSQCELARSTCQSCRWWSMCNGGCAYQRYRPGEPLGAASSFCQSRNALFEHVAKCVGRLSGRITGIDDRALHKGSFPVARSTTRIMQ